VIVISIVIFDVFNEYFLNQVINRSSKSGLKGLF